MESKLYNVQELAEFLGVKVNTVYLWVEQKRIPFVKVGRLVRFSLDEVLSAIKKRSESL
jgi:excisionase family DNA binding protein